MSDIAVLLSGRDLVKFVGSSRDDIAGIAFIGFVCKNPYNVAVVEDIGFVYKSSNVIPHEIGHILGADHDGPDNKKYNYCPLHQHIMTPNVDPGSSDSFSACTEASVEDTFLGMKDNEYSECVEMKNGKNLLSLEKHLIPMDLTAEEFCKRLKGPQHAWGEARLCTIYCYKGGFWKMYPMDSYPAPYGFKCGKGKVCYYGKCVPCTEIGSMKPWDDCKDQ
ncbi:metalloprotease mig-17-like [Haemaphysalis longicornis]